MGNDVIQVGTFNSLLQLLLIVLRHRMLREELLQRPGEALDAMRGPGVGRALGDGHQKVVAPRPIRSGHVNGPGQCKHQEPVEFLRFLRNYAFGVLDKARQL